MRSSSNTYLLGLDHMRALAAFLVVCWHSVHPAVSFDYVPENKFFSIFEEGHIGVSLFMVISGFIFTHLCYGKEVDYLAFLKNRFLRIFPLLFVYLVLIGAIWDLTSEDILSLFLLVQKFEYNGIWTLLIEFQFYLFFPIFLAYAYSKYKGSYLKYMPFVAIIVIAVIFRLMFYAQMGNFQMVAYWSIFGRIDQFMIGAIFSLIYSDFSEKINKGAADKFISAYYQMFAVAILIVGFLLLTKFIAYFNYSGGFYNFNKGSYPTKSPIWLFLTTVEGVFFGMIVFGWLFVSRYMPSFTSRFISYLGAISYSTYLGHFLIIKLCNDFFNIGEGGVVFSDDIFINALLQASLIIYPLVIIFSILTYEFIEKPFLYRRVKYLK